VDAVVGLLDGVRARGAFVLRMMMDPPWSISIRDEAPLTLICQTHGSAAIVGESSGTVWLRPGDVALTRGTEHYIFADDPTTTPMIVIHPGQRCMTLSGESLKFEMSIGVRTWGNSPFGATRSVICAYQGRSEVSARLLAPTNGTRRWWNCSPPRPVATAPARRPTWTGCSTCC
jgi:hypothetical protein